MLLEHFITAFLFAQRLLWIKSFQFYSIYLGVLPDTGLMLAFRITTTLIIVNTAHDIVKRHQKFLRHTTMGIVHNAMSVTSWNEKGFIFSKGKAGKAVNTSEKPLMPAFN